MSKIKAETSIMPPVWEVVDELVYCINCKDMGSELYGTFAYDEELAEGGAGLWATSGVYDSVDDFYEWAKSLGFVYHKRDALFTLSRKFS